MRYNLEFRKLTFYGLTRPQCIRKLKQISGQTILSSPQDHESYPSYQPPDCIVHKFLHCEVNKN